MRRLALLFLTFAVLLAVVLIAEQSEAEIETESIVALWLFDEGDGNVAKDYSDNGNDGEIKGNLAWIDGTFDNALEFPGQSGSFVLVPHSDTFNVVTFTIVAWIKAVNTGNRMEIMMKRASAGANSQNLHFQIESGRTVVDVGFTADNQWVAGLFGQKEVTDEEWHHIAATYDQEMMRLYIDGVPDGEQARNTTPDNNDAPLTIGAVFESGGSALTGALDDVGLFNVALEEEDIVDIKEQGLKEATGAVSVSPLGTLVSTWGDIKSE